MKKQAESAFGRPPSFHHILRIIVMMLLCLICATPQMSAKTTTINFLNQIPQENNDGIFELKKDGITIIFRNYNATTDICKPVSGGIEVIECVMVVTSTDIIRNITFIYTSTKNIATSGTNKDIESDTKYTFDEDGKSKAFAIKIKTLLKSVTVETSEPEPITYKLTTVSEPSDGGTISILDADRNEVTKLDAIAAGTTLEVNPIPAPHYEVEKVTVNGKELVSPDNKFTVDADTEITATFKKITYSVTITEPRNGKVSITDTKDDIIEELSYIDSGTELKVLAEPDDGYEVDQIHAIKSDKDEIITETRAFIVDAPTVITATFKKTIHAVTLSSDYRNGQVTITDNNKDPIQDLTKVENGTILLITLTADEGYTPSLKVNSELTDAQSISEDGRTKNYEISVTDALSLTPEFTINQYEVSYYKPENGTITVLAGDERITNGMRVGHGTVLAVTLEAKEGYTPSLKVNNATVEPTSTENNGRTKSYSVEITAPTTLTPEFTKNSYKVTIADSENGTVSVKAGEAEIKNGTSVDYGTVLTITPTPASGYYTGSLQINNVSVVLNNDGSYVMTVKEDVTINANFNEDKSIVQTVAVTWSNTNPDGGSITVINGTTQIDSGSEVASSSKLTVTLTPKEGYTASLESDMGGSIKETTAGDSNGVRTYEVTLTKATKLTATFTKKKYAVKIAVPENGTLTVTTSSGATINDNDEVEHGTVLTIIPTPATGYKLSSLTISTGGNDVVLNSQPYTHEVTGPITIKATFVGDDVNSSLLSFADSEQGTITVSAKDGTTTYISGQRIAVNTALVVKAKPNTGYKLTAIKAGETSQEFNTTGEGTLECTATAGTFNISATFDNYTAYSVNWTEPNDAEGSMTVKKGGTTIDAGTEIENGTTLTVTLEANDGYTPSLKVNNATVEPTSTENNGRTKSYSVEVTAPTTLTPEFTKNSYTVTIADSENGSVTVTAGDEEIPNGSSVDHGTVLTITPKPATGYKLSSLTIITGDNDVVLNSQPYTYEVTGPITIKAAFVGDDVNSSLLSFADSEQGKISVASPYNNVIYKTGDRITVNTELLIKAIPNDGYKLTRITAGSRSKEFNTAKEDTIRCFATAGPFNITATFAEYKAYAVTWTKPNEAEGSLTVKNGDAVITSGTEIESGTTLSGTLRAAEGFTPSLKVNGNTMDAKSITDDGRTKTYDITINKATVLTPQFTKNKYAVAILKAANGSVTIATSSGAAITDGNAVEHGTELIITPTPETGYKTVTVAVNGKPLTPNQGKYSHTVTEAATITATFGVDSENYATLSIIKPENGTLTVTSSVANEPHKSGDLVKVGTKLTIKAKPAEGYRLKGITAGSATYTFNDTTEKTAEPNVTKGSYAISAVFEKIALHAVSWTNANPDGGNITVTSGTETIASGAKIETGKEVTVTLTAKEGYTPSLESDVSGSVTESATGSEGLVKIYKVTITKATILTAKFIKKQPDKATIQYVPTGEGTVAFYSDAALTKPIDTTDGLKIEIGTTLYIKATPANPNYEAKVIYSTDSGTSRTLTADSNGIFQFVAADAKATLSISFTVRICHVTSRITCDDGDAAKAGTIEWKLSDTKTYDSPAKVESGKTINVRIKAAEGYRITAASGAEITEGAKVTDVAFDLSISKETEITAIFRAIPRATINLDTTISGLPTETQGKVKVTMAKADGTPLGATDKIEDGTKLRIVASSEDNRYRFTSMSIGECKATISENGTTAVIDEYMVELPSTATSRSSFSLSLDITMMRRTIAVTFTSEATNAVVSVTSTDENGNRKSITSGATVSVDTELHFRATPDAGYEIESMTVTPTTGSTLASTTANIDSNGACTLPTRTPISLAVNASVAYKIEVKCKKKSDGETYKMHNVTLSIAEGQEDYGRVRFVDPKSESMTVATERKVTFEATPTDMPADGRLGQYSFAGWSSDIKVPETERAAVEAAQRNAIYSYGGDADATFKAHFTKNCRLTFEESHTGGTMTITGADGALIESGDYVAPGTEITVTVTATPATGYRVNLIIINGAAAYLFEDYPESVTQTVTVDADMTLGCDIFVPLGIDAIDINADKAAETWYTLDGIRLGTDRPTRTGIYIVVDHKGHARKVAVTAD